MFLCVCYTSFRDFSFALLSPPPFNPSLQWFVSFLKLSEGKLLPLLILSILHLFSFFSLFSYLKKKLFGVIMPFLFNTLTEISSLLIHNIFLLLIYAFEDMGALQCVNLAKLKYIVQNFLYISS